MGYKGNCRSAMYTGPESKEQYSAMLGHMQHSAIKYTAVFTTAAACGSVKDVGTLTGYSNIAVSAIWYPQGEPSATLKAENAGSGGAGGAGGASNVGVYLAPMNFHFADGKPRDPSLPTCPTHKFFTEHMKKNRLFADTTTEEMDIIFFSYASGSSTGDTILEFSIKIPSGTKIIWGSTDSANTLFSLTTETAVVTRHTQTAASQAATDAPKFEAPPNFSTTWESLNSTQAAAAKP